MKKWRKFIYIVPKTQKLILIKAKFRPSIKNVPCSGTWVVWEWYKDDWGLPCFPEIIWERLKRMIFIGELKD